MHLPYTSGGKEKLLGEAIHFQNTVLILKNYWK